MRQVTVRRWKIGLAFAVMVALFAATIYFLTEQIDANRSRINVEHERLADQARFRRERATQTSKSDLRLCRAINTAREINNRDRVTLQRSLRTTRRALRKTPRSDPLYLLLAASEAQLPKEIADRPRLSLIRCKALPSVTHDANGKQKRSGKQKP